MGEEKCPPLLTTCHQWQAEDPAQMSSEQDSWRAGSECDGELCCLKGVTVGELALSHAFLPFSREESCPPVMSGRIGHVLHQLQHSGEWALHLTRGTR